MFVQQSLTQLRVKFAPRQILCVFHGVTLVAARWPRVVVRCGELRCESDSYVCWFLAKTTTEFVRCDRGYSSYVTSNLINGVPAFTVSELSKELKAKVSKLYPSKVWIEGEIKDLRPEPFPGGRYFKLVEGSGKNLCVFNMKLFVYQGVMERVEKKMQIIGHPLQNNLHVRFLCRLDFYPGKGELSAIIEDVDTTYTLGLIAQKRDQIIAKIVAGGFDKLNKLQTVPSVPLRFGVVSSPRADGWQDALKHFKESGYAFEIVFCASSVQGGSAPSELVSAISTLDRRRDIDLILIMRGGGSGDDLAAFDDERVAMSIAHCRHPVFTGIGHETNTSIADLVAHTQCKTPTAVAEVVIAKVRAFDQHIGTRRSSLVALSRNAIERARSRTASQADLLVAKARGKIDRAQDTNVRVAAQLAGRPAAVFATERATLDSLGLTVRLLDPATTLAKGWTLTRDSQGRVVRSVSEVEAGDVLVTSFIDGRISSQVKEVTAP